MVKLAAIISIFLGLGFGLPCAYGIRYLSTSGEVWTFLGFPTYGGGAIRGNRHTNHCFAARRVLGRLWAGGGDGMASLACVPERCSQSLYFHALR